MGFFDTLLSEHEGLTLSGVRYGFREITVSMTDKLINDLKDETKQNRAFLNFIKSGLTFLGDQKGDAIRFDSLLAEDAADMLICFRKASLGNIFSFEWDFPGHREKFEFNIEDVKVRPYSWNQERKELYSSYEEMLSKHRDQKASLMGKEIKWRIPFMNAKVNEDHGMLAKAAETRGATFTYKGKDPNTKDEFDIVDKIDWSGSNVPQKALDEFSRIWKSVEGLVDSSLTITSKTGKVASLNLVGLPGFFSEALAT